MVRCRPMEKREIDNKHERLVDMDAKRGLVSIRKLGSNENPKEFTFDAVYDWK